MIVMTLKQATKCTSPQKTGAVSGGLKKASEKSLA
jgi:hypothetical protein